MQRYYSLSFIVLMCCIVTPAREQNEKFNQVELPVALQLDI